MKSLSRAPTLLFHLGLLTLVVIIGYVAWDMHQGQQARLQSVFDRQAQNDLRLLQGLVQRGLDSGDASQVNALLERWVELRPQTQQIRVKRLDGTVIAEFIDKRRTATYVQLNAPLSLGDGQPAQLELLMDKHAPVLRPAADQGHWLVILAVVLLLLVFLSLRSSLRARALMWHNLHLREQMERLENLDMELAAERSYLRAVVDSIASVFVAVDPDGAVKQWNKAAEVSSRIKGEDALGQRFTDLMPHLAVEFDNLFQALNRHESPSKVRSTSVSGGTLRYLELRLYPLGSDAGSGAVVQVDDVTERLRFEQMLVQHEKMLSLGGLAAGVANEINNPLSGILQNCQNVQRRLSADLVTNKQAAASAGIDLANLQDYLNRREIPDILGMIRVSADRAAQIISGMLAFGHHGPGGFEKVSVQELLDAATGLAASDFVMRKQMQFDQVQVQLEVATNLPMLHCDSGRIQQVLLNLLKNAAQAMCVAKTRPPRRVCLRARAEQTGLLIQVEDNGPGMSAEVRQHAFEPFFSTYPGQAGLGLTVAYIIVTEQHRGEIDVQANAEAGVSFAIRLPYDPVTEMSDYGFSRSQ